MKVEIQIPSEEIGAQEAINLDYALTGIPRKMKIEINMSKVRRISMAGVGVLIAAIRDYKKIVLKECDAQILHKLEVLGITSIEKVKIA